MRPALGRWQQEDISSYTVILRPALGYCPVSKANKTQVFHTCGRWQPPLNFLSMNLTDCSGYFSPVVLRIPLSAPNIEDEVFYHWTSAPGFWVLLTRGNYPFSSGLFHFPLCPSVSFMLPHIAKFSFTLRLNNALPCEYAVCVCLCFQGMLGAMALPLSYSPRNIFAFVYLFINRHLGCFHLLANSGVGPRGGGSLVVKRTCCSSRWLELELVSRTHIGQLVNTPGPGDSDTHGIHSYRHT